MQNEKYKYLKINSLRDEKKELYKSERLIDRLRSFHETPQNGDEILNFYRINELLNYQFKL